MRKADVNNLFEAVAKGSRVSERKENNPSNWPRERRQARIRELIVRFLAQLGQEEREKIIAESMIYEFENINLASGISAPDVGK